MPRVQKQAPDLTGAEKAWIEENLAEQRQRHEQIVADMEELAPLRESWIGDFLARIQDLGFNYNCDLKRKIPADEIPEKPKRPLKVVF